MPRRNKHATWRSAGALCRDRDWSKRRLVHALQNGLVPYRTIPPGHVIDWHACDMVLDVEASEVTYTKGVLDVEGVIGLDRPTVGVEVLPPIDETDDVLAASLAPALPAAPAAPKYVSEKDFRDCLLAIKKEHPDGPPREDDLIEEMENRLGVPVARNRLRNARTNYAPKWKRLRGRPRKKARK